MPKPIVSDEFLKPMRRHLLAADRHRYLMSRGGNELDLLEEQKKQIQSRKECLIQKLEVAELELDIIEEDIANAR